AARCAVPTVIAVVGSIAPSARRAIASGSNAGAEGADPAGPVAPVAPVAPDGNGPTWTALNDRESHVHRSVRVTNTERSAPAMRSAAASTTGAAARGEERSTPPRVTAPLLARPCAAEPGVGGTRRRTFTPSQELGRHAGIVTVRMVHAARRSGRGVTPIPGP